MGLMLDLQPGLGRALVVGGGHVAARKVRTLTEAGFEVTVVAPEVLPEIRARAAVAVIERPYTPAELDAEPGYALVFACTGDRKVNRQIGLACRARRTPVLVADSQAESTVFTPAILRDGDLTVGVSTGGASPSLARAVREQIVQAIGTGWGERLTRARAEREERLGRTQE